jgi:hypothetical protein
MKIDLKTTLTKILEIIENEPELPGVMPDSVFEKIEKDKNGLANYGRTIVKADKTSIKSNILKYFKTLQ